MPSSGAAAIRRLTAPALSRGKNAPFSPAAVAAMQREFRKNGYFAVPNFADEDTVNGLKDRIKTIVKKAEGTKVPSFDVKSQAHTSTQYFLRSGSKVRFFLESGKKVVNHDTVNKIGHGLHTQDKVFRTFTSSSRIKSLAKNVVGHAAPTVVQSMTIMKPPRVGGPVPPHQDNTWLETSPVSVTGFWLALDDATLENGCLRMLPGSHRSHPCAAHYSLHRDRRGGTLWGTLPDPALLDRMTPVPVKAGTLLVFHGLCVHGSTPNCSLRRRQAYTFHVVDGAAQWNSANWMDVSLSKLKL